MILPHDSQCAQAASQGVDGAVGVPDTQKKQQTESDKRTEKRHWYVAVVSHNAERKVAEALAAIGIEAYAAGQNEVRVWRNGKRKKLYRIAIPSAVFVHCTESERLAVVYEPYIYRFMTDRVSAADNGRHRPAIVPDAQMNTLRFMLGQDDVPVEIVGRPYSAGDRVRVIRGGLIGLEGEVLTDSNGDTTLYVALDILGFARVAIPSSDLTLLT